MLANPISRVDQPDGRVRFWGSVPELGDETGSQVRVLRVVRLADGETIHNAFPDRSFHLTTAPEETE